MPTDEKLYIIHVEGFERDECDQIFLKNLVAAYDTPSITAIMKFCTEYETL